MACKSLDFKSDKQIRYQELGVEMANLFVDDVSIFSLWSLQLPVDLDKHSKEDMAKAKNQAFFILVIRLKFPI